MAESPPPVPEVLPISVDYTTLLDPTADLSSFIEKGFGPDGLGILTVSGIPDFPALRRALLPLATEFAQLPDSVKATYEDAESKFNVGWSCGKEILKNGRPDAFKGSFYANPLRDEGASTDTTLVAEPVHSLGDYYAKPNIWPRDHIPEFEGAFKSLGRLMYRVGLQIADLCDNHLARMSTPSFSPQGPKSLKACIERGACCCKARLLCYLPLIAATTSDRATADEEESNPDDLYWCGWHKDHCALTALCPAMYIHTPAGSAHSSDRPLERAGLYVKDRHGNIVKVRIPEDHLAFQVGESFQVLSGNVLRATPHCVRAPRPAKQGEVCPYRNTFALFMQPHWDEPLVSTVVDHQAEAHSCTKGDLVDGWRDGMTFGEFSAQRFAAYYGS